MKCRFCNNDLEHVFVDLGHAPLSNSYLQREHLENPEVYYPLKVYVCSNCFLVQLDEFKKRAEIFNNEYAYFSSYSSSWLKHAKEYVYMIIKRLGLNTTSNVVEIASNDGYLLQYFKKLNIPCLGIEPTANTARVAQEKGIKSIVAFFNEKLATDLSNNNQKADLIIGNNVLAHDPDLRGFVRSLSILLKEQGIITLEFPHLMQLIENRQFDTIYHEHFFYFTLNTIKNIFEAHGLKLIDAEEIPTHGGSLRVYVAHKHYNITCNTNQINLILNNEFGMGLNKLSGYIDFQEQVDKIKNQLLYFLIESKNKGKKIVAYGAAAKGSSLLNYCGIKKDLIQFVVDKSPHKQGKFLPGSHIPIVSEESIQKNKPDIIIILPWNIKSEIVNQLNYVQEWSAEFVIPNPFLELI